MKNGWEPYLLKQEIAHKYISSEIQVKIYYLNFRISKPKNNFSSFLINQACQKETFSN
jgi:hypothetical protein